MVKEGKKDRKRACRIVGTVKKALCKTEKKAEPLRSNIQVKSGPQ